MGYSLYYWLTWLLLPILVAVITMLLLRKSSHPLPYLLATPFFVLFPYAEGKIAKDAFNEYCEAEDNLFYSRQLIDSDGVELRGRILYEYASYYPYWSSVGRYIEIDGSFIDFSQQHKTDQRNFNKSKYSKGTYRIERFDKYGEQCLEFGKFREEVMPKYGVPYYNRIEVTKRDFNDFGYCLGITEIEAPQSAVIANFGSKVIKPRSIGRPIYVSEITLQPRQSDETIAAIRSASMRRNPMINWVAEAPYIYVFAPIYSCSDPRGNPRGSDLHKLFK